MYRNFLYRISFCICLGSFLMVSGCAKWWNTVEADGGGDETTFKPEKGKKKCNDGIDNDGDGLIDGEDPDCRR